MNINTGIFNEIYLKNMWGKSEETKFFSGGGSREPTVTPYIELIIKFIKDNNIKTITDVGCGDFYVSNKILSEVNYDNYIGIDVSDIIVSYNRDTFSTNKISFKHLDISKEEIDGGDLCLVKQVFQHLPNESIFDAMVNLLNKFSYIIVTEHVSIFPAIYNKDQPANHNVYRIWYKSGVFLDKPPFNFKTTKLLSININPEEEINSVLIKNIK